MTTWSSSGKHLQNTREVDLTLPYDSHPSLSKCVLSSESTHWDFGTEEMDSGQSLLVTELGRQEGRLPEEVTFVLLC